MQGARPQDTTCLGFTCSPSPLIGGHLTPIDFERNIGGHGNARVGMVSTILLNPAAAIDLMTRLAPLAHNETAVTLPATPVLTEYAVEPPTPTQHRITYRSPTGDTLSNLSLVMGVDHLHHRYNKPKSPITTTIMDQPSKITFVTTGRNVPRYFNARDIIVTAETRFGELHVLPPLACKHLTKVFAGAWGRLLSEIAESGISEVAKDKAASEVMRCAEAAFRTAIRQRLPFTHGGGTIDRMVYTKAITLTQMAILGLTDRPSAADDSGRDITERNRDSSGDDSSQGRGKNRRGRGRGNKDNGDDRQHYTGDPRGGTWGGSSKPRLGAHPPTQRLGPPKPAGAPAGLNTANTPHIVNGKKAAALAPASSAIRRLLPEPWRQQWKLWMRVIADNALLRNPLIRKREVWATECIGAPDLPFVLYILTQGAPA